MSMSINSLMAREGPEVHYDPRFCRTLETYMDYLRKHPDTTNISIGVHDAYKYEGDLNGLLRKYGVPTHLHWVVMRMNGFTSHLQTTPELTHLMLPEEGVVDQIRQLYLTTNKKRNNA